MPQIDGNFIALAITVVLGLLFAYSNGVNDAANAIAAVVSTRVLRPLHAVIMGSTMELLGALTGTAVAETIGKGIVRPELVDQSTAMGGILAAVLGVQGATRFGIPVSVSHSLIAGIVGAGIASAGTEAVVAGGLVKVVIALAASPFVGFFGGLLLMHILFWGFRRSTPSFVNGLFGRIQVFSAAWMAYAHGKNDGQNAAGIITFALAIHYGWSSEDLVVPLWVLLASALSISAGLAIGGWRVIQTLGMRVTKLTPVHGFAAQTGAAAVIETASTMGLPVSTTHTITSTVMGVGATERLSAVRWGVTRRILVSWILSYPVCFVLGWVLTKLLNLFL